MTEPTVRVGLVGAGFAASLHVDALRGVRGTRVELGGVAATSVESAQAFATAHGVAHAYFDYKSMLADPEIDVVCVCVPPDLHSEVILAAADARKHIICEKPLTGAFGGEVAPGPDRARVEREHAVKEVRRLADAVSDAGVCFGYAENWVYAPAVTKTKRLIKAAGGAILDIRAEEGHSGSHARRSRQRHTAGGGVLMTLGSHAVATALHLKDYEGGLRGQIIQPVAVTATTAALYDTPAMRATSTSFVVDDWDDVETWANVVITFSDGSNAVVTASFVMLGGVKSLLQVYTSDGAYHANIAPDTALQVFTPSPHTFADEPLHEKAESRSGWLNVPSGGNWARGYTQEMQDFIDAIADRREPVSGMRLAADVVDVIYASYESAEQGRRVDLDLGPSPDVSVRAHGAAGAPSYQFPSAPPTRGNT